MKKHKILIVDDNVGVTKLLQALLKQRGYEVTVAQGGEEAIKLYGASSPDLILLDLKMPDLPGDIAALRIKSQDEKSVPIIALTACGDPLAQATTRSIGFVDHIVKPFDADDLCARIEKALAASPLA